MWQFIFKRLLHMIPLLLGVSLLTFLLMSLAPGDYFTALSQNPQISPETIVKLKAQFHLDKPWYVQYFFWLKNILSGNFGYSMAYKIPATSLIFARLWNTFLLSFFALIIAWCVAIPLGIWAAVRKGSWVDHACSFVAFVGLSIPDVLLSLLALWFAAATGWFPVGGAQSPLHDLMTPAATIFGSRAPFDFARARACRRRSRRHHAPDAFLFARHVARRICHRRPRARPRRRLGDLQTRVAQRHQSAAHHFRLFARRAC